MSTPEFIGLKNYTDLFTDSRVIHSLKITILYAVVSTAMGLILSFFLALLLYQKIIGIKIFRSILYSPVIIPVVAASFVWKDLYNVDYGILNKVITSFGLKPFPFISSPKTALFSIIIFSLWGIGGPMLIWLAGFNNVPKSYYESADLDGASSLKKLLHITIPMVSPVIFYNLVMSIIANLQTFTQVFIMTDDGGPLDATNFLVLNIFRDGFRNFKMGYASAQAWVLFTIIFILTLIVFRTSRWVFYGDEEV
ncbi:carbohydrate ABC transporter permease [Thermoanaerobacterium xylanolyticum]|uniref:carbohydrate ABC transporter permease n=1 Tax=Thermoanaerobacterium xylanolyticum TaxID=29329 RepID=UPI0018A845B8|nr:sugar ABC transporter permease [Thermoanaerobacterium xylanolyticum]